MPNFRQDQIYFIKIVATMLHVLCLVQRGRSHALQTPLRTKQFLVMRLYTKSNFANIRQE